ncbi:hypothetical protein [Halanaerobium praevalens]|uniref:Sialyltransferase n=1 Tax=Halanaerobium praevalens (strain ATCC 33744 / DSM 2228 / GSL) TaxID=572479 RepID=E3DNF0_HALPG|nr:hypothetical protein [Halanaerobium praevalens]ADO76488.1 sialyltransferase [Halanaerobium praevalens DSM 2228]
MNKLKEKQLCDKIFNLEEKFNLLKKKINGVYFWKLIRFDLTQEILKEKNIYGQAHTNPGPKFIDKILYLPRALINTHLYGALKRNSQKDYLVFEHPRKVKVNEEYIDKYTHYIIADWGKDKYEIIDKPYLRKHYKNPSLNRSYFEHFSIINYLKREILPLKINDDDKKFIKRIEEELKKRFDLKIELLEKVEFKITHFKNEVKYFNKLLKKRKPKKVFLVVSYGSEALIEACKINDVTSIEIQHGIINKYHLGYSFPKCSDIPYFPDQIYLFGQYWADSTPLPLDPSELVIFGFPYLEKRLVEYRDYSKINNQVLFMSQGTIANKLTEIAYEFAKGNKNYKVIYKLHPGEYDRWQQDYEILNKAVELDNFRIIDNNDINLYQLLAGSEYQIGVYSTSIFEGLTLNCKTILLDLPGVEYMEYLIENDIVKFAENAEELTEFIKEDDFEQNYNKDYFFSGI